MINPLAALAIALGLIAIALYFALLTMVDRKVQRTRIGSVPAQPTIVQPPCPDPARINLQGAALDLMIQCELLERRNEYLEQHKVRCQEIVAGSLMLALAGSSTSPMALGTKMTIREKQEVP